MKAPRGIVLWTVCMSGASYPHHSACWVSHSTNWMIGSGVDSRALLFTWTGLQISMFHKGVGEVVCDLAGVLGCVAGGVLIHRTSMWR